MSEQICKTCQDAGDHLVVAQRRIGDIQMDSCRAADQDLVDKRAAFSPMQMIFRADAVVFAGCWPVGDRSGDQSRALRPLISNRSGGSRRRR